MIEKKNVKKLAWVAVALVIMVLSMTVVSKAASNPENHKKTIEALDEKKADILKLTATSAAASTAIAAIPGDATTPIANKLTDLTSYFLIILVVIFLEKYLVTLTGYATFSILIPAACVLFAAAFGLVIFMIIPFSMNVSAMIEKTYESTMEETVKEAQDITNEIEKNTDSEGNIIEKALSKIKDGISGLLEKGEELLNQFIELIAVMLVTSCLIPIFIFLFMIWFIRMLFGIQINVPKGVSKQIAAKMPGRKKVRNDLN